MHGPTNVKFANVNSVAINEAPTTET